MLGVLEISHICLVGFFFFTVVYPKQTFKDEGQTWDSILDLSLPDAIPYILSDVRN